MAWGAQQPKARNAGSHRRSRLLQRASLPAARRPAASTPLGLSASTPQDLWASAPQSDSARAPQHHGACLSAPQIPQSLNASAQRPLLSPAPRPPPAHLAPQSRLPPSHPKHRLLAAGTTALRRHPRAGGRGGLRLLPSRPAEALRALSVAPRRPRSEPPLVAAPPPLPTGRSRHLPPARAELRARLSAASGAEGTSAPPRGSARARRVGQRLPLAVRRTSFACYGKITARRSRHPPRRRGGPGSLAGPAAAVALRWSRLWGERRAAAPRHLPELYLSLSQLCFQSRGCA